MPVVRVSLVKTVNLLSHQSITVPVGVEGKSESPQLLEQLDCFAEETGIQMQDALVQPTTEGTAFVTLSNPHGYSCQIDQGTVIGHAHSASIVEPAVAEDPQLQLENPLPASVRLLMSETERCQLIKDTIGKPDLLSLEQTQELHVLLEEFHDTFSLDENERGETDLAEMEIQTGDASPRKVPARRMPLAVRQEVS